MGMLESRYPCLTVEESPPLSKYGRLRQRYLREHKRVLYFNLLTSGKLYEHLAEIDTSVRDMAEYLIKEMAKKQGVTEELKATDMMMFFAEVKCRLLQNAMYVGCCKIDLGGYTPKPL